MAQAYNDKLGADEQISTEEWIGNYLFEFGIDVERGQGESMSKEYCHKLAKLILLEVLTRFRPDLVGEETAEKDTIRCQVQQIAREVIATHAEIKAWLELLGAERASVLAPVRCLATCKDKELNAEELRQRYDALADGGWGEHPLYTQGDWQVEAGLGDTRMGYWDWVQNQLEINAVEEEDEKEAQHGSN